MTEYVMRGIALRPKNYAFPQTFSLALIYLTKPQLISCRWNNE